MKSILSQFFSLRLQNLAAASLAAFLFFTLCPHVTNSAEIPLTVSEQKYLDEHPVLHLGVGIAFPPFQYVEEENGEKVFKGMVSDYLKRMEELLGIRLVPVLGISFKEALEMGKKGQLELFPCIANTPERNEYLLFTRPYLSYPLVIITRDNAPFVGGIEDLHNKRVAVIKTLANYSKLANEYPDLDIDFIFKSNAQSRLEAVSLGEADACIANLAVASAIIRKRGFSNLRVAAPTPWGNNKLAMAVLKNQPELLAILTKTLGAISEQERMAIQQRWINLEYETLTNPRMVRRLILQFTIGGLIILGIMLWWNRRLQREINERKRAENQLRESQSFLGNVLTSIQDGICVLSPDLTIIHANKTLEDWFKESMPLIGKKCHFCIHDHEKPCESCPALRCLHSKQTEIETKHGPANSSIEWLEVYCYPVIDESTGEAVQIIGFIRDVTSRKKAEFALQQAHKELEQRVEERTRELEEANQSLMEMDELKSAFLSTVSHDIRTPLTSVLGFAKLAAKDYETLLAEDVFPSAPHNKRIERIRGNLQTIISEGGRLTRLINDYLDLSKIESGRVDWNDSSIDLKDLVAHTISIMSFVIAENDRLDVQTSVQEGLPPIWADFDRMLQVLVNLVDNAAKHTPEGIISVTMEKTSTGGLRIEVADQGRGIPPAELAKIFDRFYQVTRDDTLSDRAKGTGLGLAICKLIVANYDGVITAHSQLGKGSTFTIEFPPTIFC